jgi:Uma2 family endonuclease
VRLPEGEEKEDDILTVVQPDLLVVCDEDKLDKKGCKGAPDLMIEIISPSSGGRDRRDKRDLYEKHGVKEYWLVDYNEKIVEVYLLNEDGQYGKPAVYLEDDKVPVDILNGLEIDLSYIIRE